MATANPWTVNSSKTSNGCFAPTAAGRSTQNTPHRACARQTASSDASSIFRDNPETLHRIAAHMSDGGHSEGAIELFRWLAEVVPESRSTMMVCVGNAQLRLGDAVSAADSYRKAIEADPDSALAYSRLGDIEADNRRNGKAAEYYARACELEPENWRYQGFAGTAYLQEADYGQAAAYLRRSVELFPEQPLMLYNLGVALCFQGGEEAAIQELTKAVGIDEGYARGWYFSLRPSS
jgi:tetratricopeptide (TPR) repeat protein